MTDVRGIIVGRGREGLAKLLLPVMAAVKELEWSFKCSDDRWKPVVEQAASRIGWPLPNQGESYLQDGKQGQPRLVLSLVPASDPRGEVLRKLREGGYALAVIDWAALSISGGEGFAVAKLSKAVRATRPHAVLAVVGKREWEPGQYICNWDDWGTRSDDVKALLDAARCIGISDVPPALDDVFGAPFVGCQETLQRIYQGVITAASGRFGVMIRGESGTGKELVAKAIHTLSDRKGGPFVTFNIAAIEETMAAGDLFGVAPNSATGVDPRPGAFLEANGGTLFLDEIGEMPQGIQPMILRAMEDSEIRKVGGTGTVKVDVRVIAATNRDLEAAVRAEKFLGGLYFRFRTTVQLPTLAERGPPDILALLEHFFGEATEKFMKEHPRHSAGCRYSLMARDQNHLVNIYRWPGNVRQLESFVAEITSGRQPGPIQLTAEEHEKLDREASAVVGCNPQPVSTAKAAGVHSQEVEHYRERIRETAKVFEICLGEDFTYSDIVKKTTLGKSDTDKHTRQLLLCRIALLGTAVRCVLHDTGPASRVKALRIDNDNTRGRCVCRAIADLKKIGLSLNDALRKCLGEKEEGNAQ